MGASVDTRSAGALVADYFTRLAGSEVTLDTPLRLSSAKIGAAESWLRRQGIVYDRSLLASGRFTLGQLLQASGASDSPAPAHAPPSHSPETDGTGGVGIDIEAKSSLPDADDYRAHPFYLDNFTDRELAHCLERRDAKESLAGLWAAKEAIRKLQGGPGVATSLKAIEIAHDPAGAPGFPGVALSISHAGEFAVAVAVRAQAPATPALPAPPSRPGYRGLSFIALALSVLALAGALWALIR